MAQDEEAGSAPEGQEVDVDKVITEEEQPAEDAEPHVPQKKRTSIHDMIPTKFRRANTSTMESSVFRFKDVNFVVGKGENEKKILSDVSGKIKFGHVLAVMGPSGAGKTTLISALTLEAFYGTPSGKVTLNDTPITDKVFKRHCYVVKQHDKHWPYLTCRETLSYAAELYDVAEKKDIPAIVDEIIKKMGLTATADTRCSSMSGGQQRRLSIGMALLKQPTLMFLDEPTSGLDAAAAENIMLEIVRVAKEEKLIVMCTIHQPSTRVYEGFDELMIMSKGREAFSGNVDDAPGYFDSIGYPLPVQTNPAEHFLDLVNADFSDEETVVKILDTWEEKKGETYASSHGKVVDDDEGHQGVEAGQTNSLVAEMLIMMRRHATLIVRDPILYLGRCGVFLMANIVFGLVYLSIRDKTQDQAQNKLWISIWYVAVPCNMGVVAVYALNDEFKSVVREIKNGMVSPTSYIMAKFILVLPVMFVFAVFALVVPGLGISGFPTETFGMLLLLWAAQIYMFENLAECLAVWFEDPIVGMLQFMNYWFSAFLFAGFLLPEDDLFWPFKLFYYILPYQYYIRSAVYNVVAEESFDACDTNEHPDWAICVDSTDGRVVLGELKNIYPVLDSDDRTGFDIGIILIMAAVFKLMFIAGVYINASKTSHFKAA